MKAKSNQKGKGSIIRKPGSQNLYFLFYYYGERIERSTGLPDTPENREKAQNELAAMMYLIKKGTFCFSEAFPDARPETKALFTSLEGEEYAEKPKEVNFAEFVKGFWMANDFPVLGSQSTKDEYEGVINSIILPFLGEKSFHEVTRSEIKRFILTIKQRPGQKKGSKITRKRISNIITVLRSIIESAIDKYHWVIPDPLRDYKKHLPKGNPSNIEAFRFDDWMAILDNMKPYYRPIAHIMIMTGMLISELSAIEKSDIKETYIEITKSLVKGKNQGTLKSPFRIRELPYTKELRPHLEIVLARTASNKVFTRPNGKPLSDSYWRRHVWYPALKKAKVRHAPPKNTRTTYATWSLLIGQEEMVLQYRMGHRDLEMIKKHYVKYTRGLENDREKILAYLGPDILA